MHGSFFDTRHTLGLQLRASLSKAARSDVLGGVLLLLATCASLVLANSAGVSWYEGVRDLRFGIPELHLELSVGAWAADGLLAIFFFVVGLELKEELVSGRLRDPRQAAIPVAAAVGGVLVPALAFLLVTAGSGPNAASGWAIPTATDIAFAVAVLAVVGRFLPPALRVFLLTLAIVDDLIAITVIATVYTETISFPWLTLATLPLAGFAALVRRGVRSGWVLIPLAVAVWVCVHASGVHATIAGVALGFVVPVAATEIARVRVDGKPEMRPAYRGMAGHFAHRWSLVSTLIAVPVFAFFAAGVPIGGVTGLASAMSDPVAVGIIVGLVLGKPVGILGMTFLVTRFRSLHLDSSLRWSDLAGMSCLAGIGFTVSLLVGELAFEPGSPTSAHVEIGVLVGSLLAALIGGAILATRNARARATFIEKGAAPSAHHEPLDVTT